jgi:hypothetical protein
MNNLITNTTSSRRSFFTRSAAVFGAGALAAKIISAQSPTTGTTTTAAATTDLDILNYALALENLEAAFYTMYAGKFSAADFNGSNTVPVFGTKVTGNITSYISSIRDHELAHVAALNSTITSLGGTPIAACVYNFGINNVNDFLMAAMALENTGVMAYDGAIAMISSPTVKQAAATIATVEARHAAYLNVLNGTLPFPSAFDTPKAMADVLAIAGQYISSCPSGSSPTNNPNGPTISGLAAAITTHDPTVAFDLSGSAGAGSTAVSFMLTQVSGGISNITGAKTSDPQVILLGGHGVYVFQLVITDKFGVTQTGRTTITYN